MTEYVHDLNPVQNIIADAIGEPGKRTFFLQGRSGSELISLLLEKQEVANLAISVVQLLEDLEKKHPDLRPATAPKRKLRSEQPVEPIFRVGQLILGYDEDEDKIWVIAKALIVTDEGKVVDPDSEDVPAVRFVATRDQMRALSDYALEVVSKGRPTCPLCGGPIDRAGHFCPRSDGQAVPVIF